jgi:hypothetical protein
MRNYRLAFAALTVLTVSNTIFTLSSLALTNTFTDRTSFLNNTAPSFYLEDFNSQIVNTPVNLPLTFSQNGFSYAVTAVNLNNPNVSPKPFFDNTFGSPALSTDLINFTSIVISFTSGNVTAVGGNIFTTRPGVGAQSQGMNSFLNDGTTLNVNSTTIAPGPFIGFTSDTPITSLTISIDNGSNRNPNLDNFYVGAVPVPFEFSPKLGVLGLIGVWSMNKLYKTLKKG